MSGQQNFDPNDIAIPNGNIFGFPYTENDAKIIILPVPWEVTTSYGSGASKAPKAILDASLQLDFYDPYVKNAWDIAVYMKDISSECLSQNNDLKIKAQEYIEFLESGSSVAKNTKMAHLLDEINQECGELNLWVMIETLRLLEAGKLVGILGGDHSVPFGFLKALAKKYDHFSILHIDAHADLRHSYEGFTFSHASIMYNALNISQLEKLVQVGIRDICPAEMALIENSDGRVKTFYDWDIKGAMYEGTSWQKICDDIIFELTENVYISFDVDGLDPKLCPNTGTPVPGGLEFSQVIYLFNRLVNAGRKIIGFDLCEVCPGKDEWDANVGARILYKLVNFMAKSHQS